MDIYCYRVGKAHVEHASPAAFGIKQLYHDLWVRRGIGVFTTFIARHGMPFHLEDHLRRLRTGCREASIPCATFLTSFLSREIAARAHRRPGDWRFEITVTPGFSEDSWTPDGSGHVFIARFLLNPVPSDGLGAGVALKTLTFARPQALVKDRNYRMAWSAYQKAAARGEVFNDILYCADGEVWEASRSNIFFVKGKRVYTPSALKALPGVTRGIIIRLLRRQGLIVEDTKPLYTARISSFDEAFITSSISGIRPVRAIDGHVFRGGDITRKVHEAFQTYQQKYFSRRAQVSSYN